MQVEALNVRRDGTRIPIEVSISKVTGMEGELFISVVRDITERKRAEEEIRTLNQFLDSVIDSANVWLNVLDEKANVVIWNRAAEEISGYSREEVVGHGKIWEWLYPDEKYRHEVVAEATAIIEKGEEEQDVETTIQRKDGQTRIISWNSQNLVDAKGNPIGSIALGRDITERRRAQEEIRQRNRELAALNAITTAMMQSALDLNEVLQRIVDGIVKGLGCNTAFILLLDEEKEVFRGGAVSTKAKMLARINALIGSPLLQIKIPARIDFNEAMTNLLNGRITIKHDFYELVKPFWSRQLASTMQRLLNSKTFFTMPLLAKGKTIGGIIASTRDKLTEKDTEKLMTFANQAAIAIENAQLHQETQRRALEQETLREAALALTTALDRNQVIDRILAQLQQVAPFDSASVQLLRENQVELVVVGGRGFPNLPDLLGISFPADGDNPNSEVIRTRAPFIVDDVLAVYEVFQEDPHQQTAIRSWLGVPMLVGERLVGMITLDKREPGFYTQKHARLAEAFAAQAAVAFENARLFEETRQRMAELDALRRTSLQLTSSLDLADVLASITGSTLSLVGGSDCHIYLYDEMSQTFTFGTALWQDGRQEAAVKTPRRDGFTAAVAREGQVMVINDATQHPLYTSPEARKWGLQAIAGFPLKRAGRVLGVFNIAFLTPHTFSQEERRVLGLMADQAAIAIENARLFTESEQRAAELSTMLEVARAVSSTLDLDQSLTLIAEEMAKAIGVDGCALSQWDREADAVVVLTEWRHRLTETANEPGTSYALDDYPATRAVLEKRQPITILATDPDAEPTEVALMQRAGVASLLMLPLVIGERVIGLVELDETEREREFTDGEIRLCQALADQVAVAIENARLFEEEKRRNSQLALINDVGEKAASILDLDRLMQEVTRSIQESFNYYSVALLLLDDERREVVMQTIAGGFEHVVPAEYRQSIDQGIAGFVARAGKSWLASDVNQDPYYIKGFSEEVLTESELCIPIKLGDKVIGVLDMQSVHLNDFEQADVVVMEAVADRMAIAIQNARLFEETRRHTLQLQTVEEVGRRVSAILDPDELFPYVVQAIQQNFGYYHVDILLVDQATGYVVFKASSDPAAEKVWKEQTLRFKIGEEGMIGWVAQTGEPLLTNDVSQEPRYLPDELLPETKSELVVPLKIEERVVGVLDVSSDKLDAFDEESVFVLQTLANQVAIAIENARLFEEEKRRATQLTLINEVGKKAASILDSNRLMQETTRSIQESFNYYNVALFLLDEARREVVLQTVAGGFEHGIAGDYRQSLDEGIIGFAVRTGESYLANDISEDPYYVKGFLEEALNKSELCIPVKLGDKVIGALVVLSIHLNDFDQADVTAMEAVADRLAMGIQNARLYEEMAGLYDVGLAVTSALELDKTLRAIYEQVNRLMSPDTFYLALYDEARGEELRFDIFVEEGEWLPKFTKKLDKGGLTTWIVQSGKPLFIGDLEEEEEEEEGGSLPATPSQRGKPGTRSWMGFPLIARDKVVGVISVQSFRPQAFTEGNKRILAAFANQAAIAIENARLYETAQQELAERKRAEGSLRQYERIISATDDHMSFLDRNYIYQAVNEAYLQAHQKAREEIVGHSVADLLGTDVFERLVKKNLDRCLAGEEIHYQSWFDYPGLGQRYMDVAYYAYSEIEGAVLGVVVSLHDITERLRAEEALRESEEKYRTILKSIEESYYEVDVAGNLTFFNDSLCRLLGYSEDELMGMNNRQYMDDVNAKALYQTFDTVYRTGKPTRVFDWEVIRKDGTRKFVEASVSLMKDPTGEPVGFRGVVRDVTERKQVEEAAQRRAAQAALAYEVGRRVSGELELGELLSAIVTTICDAFDYHGVMMLLLDDKAEYLTLQSIAGGYIGIFPEDLQIAVGEGMIGYAAATGETQASGDVSQDPHYVRKANEETKSELAVPIKSGQKVIGVLDLQNDEFDAFDETDVMLMETLADQVAIAIENAHLFEEIEERRVYLEGVLGAAPDAIVTLNAHHRVVEWNACAEKLFGYSPEEVIGKDTDDLITSPDVLEEAVGFTQIGLGGRDIPPTEVVRYRKDGSPVDVLLAGSPILVRDELIGTVVVYTDITERVRAEREIEERRMYLEAVLGAAPDAIVTLDAHHRIVEWNTGAERLFRYSREEAIGRELDHLVTKPDMFKEAIEFTQVVMSGLEVRPTEIVRYRKDGSPVDVLMAGSPILVRDESIGAVAVYTDITARKRMEETLRALALVDDLTSLYNRRGFLTLGQQQLKAANRAKRKMMLIFADFDGLKQINDAFGHPEGDRALIETADVLRETFRESDILARISGDEFVVLAIETDGLPAETLRARLKENLEARSARGDLRYKLSLSVGLARYDPEHPCSIDDLLTQADRAMYEQKRSE